MDSAVRQPLDAALVPNAIGLLAWDDVAHASAEALQAVAAGHAGQLVDAMLDPGCGIAVRQRLPGVLAAAATPRGLEDARFEVRYR